MEDDYRFVYMGPRGTWYCCYGRGEGYVLYHFGRNFVVKLKRVIKSFTHCEGIIMYIVYI